MDTNEPIDSLAAIRARISEIECELFAPAAFASTNILSANCAELNRKHELRFQTLGRERTELLAKLPSTGRQSLVINKALGDIHNWPAPEPIDDGYDPTDPYARFEREVGIFRDE